MNLLKKTVLKIFNINNRKIIGNFVNIEFIDLKKNFKAKVDTGADYSSIDKELYDKLPDDKKKVIGTKIIKSALGVSRREFVELEIVLLGEKFKTEFSIADRKRLKYRVLIGKNLIKSKNYLIDLNLDSLNIKTNKIKSKSKGGNK